MEQDYQDFLIPENFTCVKTACTIKYMQKKKLVVSKKETGRRLDVFVQKHFPGFSRTWIQKLIKEGAVSVNNQHTTPSKKLKEGELVSVLPEKPEVLSLKANKTTPKIPIVYEDRSLLVINKPSGVVVHPSLSHREGTIAHWLVARYPRIKKVGENPLRPGIVHRLDKDASGLMVIAKTATMFARLKKMFQDRTVEKKYLVLVRGELKQNHGEISLPIARSKHETSS